MEKVPTSFFTYWYIYLYFVFVFHRTLFSDCFLCAILCYTHFIVVLPLYYLSIIIGFEEIFCLFNFIELVHYNIIFICKRRMQRFVSCPSLVAIILHEPRRLTIICWYIYISKSNDQHPPLVIYRIWDFLQIRKRQYFSYVC